jgi:hypothetical protein
MLRSVGSEDEGACASETAGADVGSVLCGVVASKATPVEGAPVVAVFAGADDTFAVSRVSRFIASVASSWAAFFFAHPERATTKNTVKVIANPFFIRPSFVKLLLNIKTNICILPQTIIFDKCFLSGIFFVV